MDPKSGYDGMRRKEIFIATWEGYKEKRTGSKIKMRAYLNLNQTYMIPSFPWKLGTVLPF